MNSGLYAVVYLFLLIVFGVCLGCALAELAIRLHAHFTKDKIKGGR